MKIYVFPKKVVKSESVKDVNYLQIGLAENEISFFQKGAT